MSFSTGKRLFGCVAETITCISIWKGSELIFRREKSTPLVTKESWSDANVGWFENNKFALPSLVALGAYSTVGPAITRAITMTSSVYTNSVSSATALGSYMRMPSLFVAVASFFAFQIVFDQFQLLLPTVRIPVDPNVFDSETFRSRVYLNPLVDSLIFHTLLFTRLLAFQPPFAAAIFSSTAYAAAVSSRSESRAHVHGHTGPTAALSNFMDSLYFQALYIVTGARAMAPILEHYRYNVIMWLKEASRTIELQLFDASSLWQSLCRMCGLGVLAEMRKRETHHSSDLMSLCEELTGAYSSDGGGSLCGLDLGDLACAVLTNVVSAQKQEEELYGRGGKLAGVFINDTAYSFAQSVLTNRQCESLSASGLCDFLGAVLLTLNMSPTSFRELSPSRARQMLWWSENSDEPASAEEESMVMEVVNHYYQSLLPAARRQMRLLHSYLVASEGGHPSKRMEVDWGVVTGGEPPDSAAIGAEQSLSLRDTCLISLPVSPAEIAEGPSGLSSCLEDTKQLPITSPASFSDERKKLLVAGALRRGALCALMPYGLTIRRYNRMVKHMRSKYASVNGLVEDWETYINGADFVDDIIASNASSTVGHEHTA